MLVSIYSICTYLNIFSASECPSRAPMRAFPSVAILNPFSWRLQIKGRLHRETETRRKARRPDNRIASVIFMSFYCYIRHGTRVSQEDQVFSQCCGSMTLWCGSGSGSGSTDSCLWLMDPDPESRSCYFRHWPSRFQQKANFCIKKNSAYYKIKGQKEPQNSRNQSFSYYLCMMVEGSGTGRPKNMWEPVDPDPGSGSTTL